MAMAVMPNCLARGTASRTARLSCQWPKPVFPSRTISAPRSVTVVSRALGA